ncbi:MAG: hypothetical protein ACI8ZT_001835 [Bacteroidia bacterium]|jgi:hypothetical protein
MKRSDRSALLLSCSQPVVADANTFSENDLLFVSAQVVGCGTHARLVEYGRITELGGVTLFVDIVLDVQGKTTSEVTSQLVDAWELRTGQRPKTIRIKRVAENDPKTATMWMLRLLSEKKQCGKHKKSSPPSDADWQFEGSVARVLPHNQSLNEEFSPPA